LTRYEGRILRSRHPWMQVRSAKAHGDGLLRHQFRSGGGACNTRTTPGSQIVQWCPSNLDPRATRDAPNCARCRTQDEKSTMTDDAHDAWQRILGRLRTAVAGEFEILREIGSGGMAAVYLARELALHRLVAIKVMSPALLTGNGMVERFRQEARTIAGLDHRNIITIYAVRDYEDLHFFVMKFIKGRSLEHIIRTAGPLPIPMVRGLLYMVGDGLGHAHRRNVVHRDVKPANILIDADGNASNVFRFRVRRNSGKAGGTYELIPESGTSGYRPFVPDITLPPIQVGPRR